MSASALPDPHRAVRRWIALICWLVLAMISLGGVTRLTQSGLSMVTWEPILGALPPRTDADWEMRFAQYRQFPEYQKLNAGMTLPDFKRIFWWEYAHRLVGRLTGVVFLPPLLWFLFRGRLRGALGGKLAVVFVFGGLQGALGWFMVKSGLADNPRVSHFRLAAHLSLALLLLSWLYWMQLDLVPEARALPGPARLRRGAAAFLALLLLQIVLGAFVAGLHAGAFFNTWPKMLGAWVAPQAFDFARNGLADLVTNPVTIQFLHRTVGGLVALGAFALWHWGRHYILAPRARRALRLLPALTALQFALGVATLLRYVPVPLAAAHQLTAALLLLAAVGLAHGLRAAPAR